MPIATIKHGGGGRKDRQIVLTWKVKDRWVAPQSISDVAPMLIKLEMYEFMHQSVTDTRSYIKAAFTNNICNKLFSDINQQLFPGVHPGLENGGTFQGQELEGDL